jgi:archaeosine-15-forming tRNA-guanine transglycosylase
VKPYVDAFITGDLTGKGVFVMPHWSSDYKRSEPYLREALAAIRAQTDPDWHLIVVDDKSPEQVFDRLGDAFKGHEGAVTVIRLESNHGPGYCRNVAIAVAARSGAPFVLFNDADDISHPRRVEVVRSVFAGDDDAAVVYSTFEPVDEKSKPVAFDRLTPSLREILTALTRVPARLEQAWIPMGTEFGYFTLTSATAARIDIALAHPFPSERVAEDLHAWYRYGAAGGAFVFRPEIPTKYRVTSAEGSASRAREGREAFYRSMMRIDEDGFHQAFEIALESGRLLPEARSQLESAYYLRLARTLEQEGQLELSATCRERAITFD